MLNKRLSVFHDLVREAQMEVGNNAPRITDRIIARAFPSTHSAADVEGADKMLRMGVIAVVKTLIRSDDDIAQEDFAGIEASFGHITSKLKKGKYYVPSEDEYVSVFRLVAEPELLDEARHFMRQKGEECLAEAENLDELYAAVTE